MLDLSGCVKNVVLACARSCVKTSVRTLDLRDPKTGIMMSGAQMRNMRNAEGSVDWK